ncbi:hypothetical protein HK104_005907 [Borealophlyctis nickersoniae]|nr:hypothetical protein HK104_005907 [Borealophlyctis nickersoniae]
MEAQAAAETAQLHREELERAAASRLLGGDGDDDNDVDYNGVETELPAANAQLGQMIAEMQAENNDLRREMQAQQQMMSEQMKSMQNMLANLQISGGASGVPMPPQSPLPLQPRVPSPTPSITSSMSFTSDVDQTLFKSLLSTIPKYDEQGGPQKLYEYIQHVDECFELADLTPKQQYVLGTHKLTGGARMMIRSHQQLAATPDKARDWEDVKRLLLERFTTKEQQLLVRQQMFQIKQTGTVTDYTHRFDMLLMQLPQRDTDETYVTLYLNGLKDEVKKAVSLNSENLNDLLSLKSAALRYDQVIKPPSQRQPTTALTAQEEKQQPGDDASACVPSKNCPTIKENLRRINEGKDGAKQKKKDDEESAHTACAYLTHGLLDMQVALEAQVAESEDRDRIEFIVNSESTQHMTPHSKWLDPKTVKLSEYLE